MPPSFTLRLIAPADRPQWEPLWRAYQSPRHSPDDVTNLTWHRFFDTLEPMHAFVATEADTIIAFAHFLYHRSTAQPGSVCYLQDMFTLQSHRGRGAARALIDAICDHAKAAGAARVYWNTSETNTQARALYDKVATLTKFVQYRRYL